ncbi:MAG: orotidine 5'-phosphate decarboxylase / HUMPS family protein [Patescibacteria group bacterium]
MGPIIFPMDKRGSQEELLAKLAEILLDPTARELIGAIKINDAAHLPGPRGSAFLAKMRGVIVAGGSDAGIFLDLKLADTSDTNVNTVSRYINDPDKSLIDPAGIYAAPNILTVRESVSVKGWLELRRALPNTKLALVSVLTDMTEVECRRRYGMVPLYKILTDIDNIRLEYAAIRTETDNPEPFDMVVCSPLEVRELFHAWGHRFQFIVPGIRDSWMLAGQQKRFTGIREALNLGATFVVAGAQIAKGNPDATPPISADESRQRTFVEVRNSNHVQIVPGDHVAMLDNCDGFYESPRDASGNYVGPLVAYAGKYDTPSGELNFVGRCYFNLAKVEERPLVRQVFCRDLAGKFKNLSKIPGAIMGMPMGSIQLTATLGDFLGCRTIFAEKKVIEPASEGKKEKSILVLGRHEVKKGEVVFIVEDVCNNFSTTDKAIKLIEEAGGIFGGIICFVNRSDKTEWAGKPIVSLIHKPSPEFKQDDSAVRDLIAAGNICWEPKKEWARLKKAMADAQSA